MSKKSFFKKMTKCAALALVFGVVGGTAFSGASYFIGQQFPKSTQTESSDTAVTKIQPTSTAASVSSSDISDVVDEVMPSIVAITSMTQQEVQSFFGQGQIVENESSGSGILVNKDDNYLYVATNNHVVEGSTALTVQFSDGTTASATVRGTDPSDDLSVVQVALSDLSEDTLNTIKIATIGDSDQLAVGEAAIAIGNALGYGQSVTTGVISALGREVTIQDETTGESISNSLIQTDAAINPGNSGGALLNVSGEVIGINSNKIAGTKVEGMGYAIPISTAKPIIAELMNKQTRTPVEQNKRGYLGISGLNVDSQVQEMYGIPVGVYISRVYEGTAAQKAGLKKGDIIISCDGETVETMEGLSALLDSMEAGTSVQIGVMMSVDGGYQERILEVTLDGNQ